MNTLVLRKTGVGLSVLLLSLSLAGCPGGGSKVDGIYHPVTGGPITITLKDNKATMQMGNESKTLDYKLEGNKLTIMDTKEGNVEFTVNDDGTLTGQLGVMKKG